MKVTTDSCFFGAWATEEIKNEKLKMKNVLDIGAGSGLLSLMIAQKNIVNIDAVEIDQEASQQAKENIEASPWKNKIRIFNEDILSFEPGKKYDCIICNPPFYENELASGKQVKNIAHHSHKLKLRQLVEIIKNKLASGGNFFLLLPFKRNYEFKRLLENYPLFISKEIIVRQSANHQPFRTMFMCSTEEKEASLVSEIIVRNEKQEYTPEFIELLKDYYLYL